MDYIKTLTNQKNISQTRLDLINRLIEKKFDYRVLINIRDNLIELSGKGQ